MTLPALPVSLIKGTDSIEKFNKLGVRGTYEGNTNIDRLIDPRLFSSQALFLNPNSLKHAPALLGQANGLLFNCITDPDINPQCLLQLNKALKAMPKPIVNHPAAVLKTRRHQVASLLKDIDGLIVPNTAITQGKRLSNFQSAIAGARIKYPLLIRSTGSHNQENLLKINAPSSLREACKLAGKECYITEFHDYQSPDQLYRKCRFFVFATGKVVARHMFIGPDWKVGVQVRKSFMASNPKLWQEESAYLENFQEIVGRRRLETLRKIRERLSLDYVGIDAHLLPSGKLLLFEANIAMNVGADFALGSGFEYLRNPYQSVSNALAELLLSRILLSRIS
jgi:hypothetical protein